MLRDMHLSLLSSSPSQEETVWLKGGTISRGDGESTSPSAAEATASAQYRL